MIPFHKTHKQKGTFFLLKRREQQQSTTYSLLNRCLRNHRISMASSVFFTHSHCYSSKPSSLVFRQVGVGPTSLRFSSSHVASVGIKLSPSLHFFLSVPTFCVVFGFWVYLGSLLFNKKNVPFCLWVL